MGEIINITKERMKYLMNKKDAIDELNKKLQNMRKLQLYHALKESTIVRTDLFKKIKTWIELLEARLFSPENLEKMDNRQIIHLFKYVGEYSIKMLAQIGDMETILKSYTEAIEGAVKMETLGEKNKEEVDTLKRELIKGFFDSLSSKAEEAIIETEKQSKEIAIPIEDGPLKEDIPDLDKIDDKIKTG